jgi:hypothetical protein
MTGPRAPYIKLFLASFGVLFLELALIRWVPAYIRMLGYFSNFVLIGSLLGCGVGVLTHANARLRLPPLPILLLVLIVIVMRNQLALRVPTTDILFYGAVEPEQSLWIIPLVVGAVAIVFVPFGQQIGRLFADLPPLTAYAVDIGGSLAGIAAFAALAMVHAPPVVWFALIIAVATMVVDHGDRRLFAFAAVGVLAVTVVQGAGSIWSPYYRIDHAPMPEHDGHQFFVNGTGHQAAIPTERRESFYYRPYDVFGTGSFRRILIIGAGSGSDVAVALANGVEHVDAVEIDGVLTDLGRQYHPDRPYSDPRVTVIVNDGRAVLRHTEQRYDMIIFALTDSLTLTSAHANIRLETFLFTEQAMREARQRLTDSGILVLYNYYREDWSIRRLAGLMEKTFGHQPFVTTYGASGRAAVLMAGPRLAGLPQLLDRPYAETGQILPGRGGQLPVIGEGRLAGDPGLRLSSDDWPFLYLKDAAIPRIYLVSMLMVAGVAAVMLGLAKRPSLPRRTHWHFFFLGAAFMLLETRSLVTFALLFGTTWIVNALVFFAILLSVLGGVAISARFTIRRLWLAYGALFGILLLNYWLPADALLAIGSETARYVAASVLAFSPIPIANIIFAQAFRQSEKADQAFGANLLGILVGGMCEYGALVIGYPALLLVAAGFYALAMIFMDAKPGTAPA